MSKRYKAVLAVIADGRSVTEVAKDWGVSRQTMHGWLARYEEEGLEGLNNAVRVLCAAGTTATYSLKCYWSGSATQEIEASRVRSRRI